MIYIFLSGGFFSGTKLAARAALEGTVRPLVRHREDPHNFAAPSEPTGQLGIAEPLKQSDALRVEAQFAPSERPDTNGRRGSNEICRDCGSSGSSGDSANTE